MTEILEVSSGNGLWGAISWLFSELFDNFWFLKIDVIGCVMLLVSLVKIFCSLGKRALFKYCVSLAHFLAAKCFLSGYNLSKISKGSTNKPWACCCQSNVIPFLVKVEQKQKTAANSPRDRENAYILAAVKWKKIMAENGINWLSDKIPYLTEIPLCERTQELDRSGETRHGAFSLNMQKMFTCKWLSKPEGACMCEEHSAHTDID